jgi:hypothetical protein
MLLGVGALAVLSSCASLETSAGGPGKRILGWSSDLGKGTVASYAEFDAS